MRDIDDGHCHIYVADFQHVYWSCRTLRLRQNSFTDVISHDAIGGYSYLFTTIFTFSYDISPLRCLYYIWNTPPPPRSDRIFYWAMAAPKVASRLTITASFAGRNAHAAFRFHLPAEYYRLHRRRWP